MEGRRWEEEREQVLVGQAGMLSFNACSTDNHGQIHRPLLETFKTSKNSSLGTLT